MTFHTIKTMLAVLAPIITLTQSQALYHTEDHFHPSVNKNLDLPKLLGMLFNYNDDIFTIRRRTYPEVSYSFDPPMYDFIPYEVETERSVSTDTLDRHHDLTYLSYEDKERLKDSDSIEEVVQITGLPLLQETKEEVIEIKGLPRLHGLEGDSELLDIPAEGKRKVALKSGLRRRRPGNNPTNENDIIPHAEAAHCKPEEVRVALEARKGYRVVPSCIRVKKCGGCCKPRRECVPTTIKELQLKTVEVKLNGFDLIEQVINVTQELECACACTQREEHCLPTQKYHPDSCSCVCKPEFDMVRRLCEESRRVWNMYECKCQCPVQGPLSQENCGSGQRFNPDTCTCS